MGRHFLWIFPNSKFISTYANSLRPKLFGREWHSLSHL